MGAASAVTEETCQLFRTYRHAHLRTSPGLDTPVLDEVQRKG
jgi:hypothetical protein